MRKIAIVSATSAYSDAWRVRRGYRTWDQCWQEHVARYFVGLGQPYQIDMGNFKTFDFEDLIAHDLVILCGSGMHIYEWKLNEDVQNYIRMLSRILWKVPIIGSCFGHQALGFMINGTVKRLPEKEMGVVTHAFWDGEVARVYTSHNDVLTRKSWENGHVERVDQYMFPFTRIACAVKVPDRMPVLSFQHHPEWERKDIEAAFEREGTPIPKDLPDLDNSAIVERALHWIFDQHARSTGPDLNKRSAPLLRPLQDAVAGESSSKG